MTIDVESQPVDRIELADIEFHALVRAELTTELNKWLQALEKVPPDRLQNIQGKIEILRWVLSRMHAEILTKEQAKAAAAEKANDQ